MEIIDAEEQHRHQLCGPHRHAKDEPCLWPVATRCLIDARRLFGKECPLSLDVGMHRFHLSASTCSPKSCRPLSSSRSPYHGTQPTPQLRNVSRSHRFSCAIAGTKLSLCDANFDSRAVTVDAPLLCTLSSLLALQQDLDLFRRDEFLPQQQQQQLNGKQGRRNQKEDDSRLWCGILHENDSGGAVNSNCADKNVTRTALVIQKTTRPRLHLQSAKTSSSAHTMPPMASDTTGALSLTSPSLRSKMVSLRRQLEDAVSFDHTRTRLRIIIEVWKRDKPHFFVFCPLRHSDHRPCVVHRNELPQRLHDPSLTTFSWFLHDNSRLPFVMLVMSFNKLSHSASGAPNSPNPQPLLL